jgi:hypothetical protein
MSTATEGAPNMSMIKKEIKDFGDKSVKQTKSVSSFLYVLLIDTHVLWGKKRISSHPKKNDHRLTTEPQVDSCTAPHRTSFYTSPPR